ncbi:MAG TPA: DUF1501 domain-containing protein [Pirellulales bacterium]|jgi:hypothetical protein|nr:DUF1501 domain-containing protein [Pirellulales bacterium]
MLRFFSGKGARTAGISRRQWLQIGTLAGLETLVGGRAPRGVDATKSKIAGFGRARSVILVYASGGQSQLDTWDPKPSAPDGIRGEFAPIATAVPGVNVCEHMPRLARLADRYTIVRSVSHDDLDHGSASYLALTGRFHARKSSNPPPSPSDDPTYGAVLKRVHRNDRFPYDCVHVNGPLQVPVLPSPGQNAGFLGRNYEPLVIGDASTKRVALADLDRHVDVSLDRLNGRQSLRAALEAAARDAAGDRTRVEMDQLYRQAFELLNSPQVSQAFDLSLEDSRLRDRYGRHRSGQACLLARRLVEAGVPLVTVFFNHTARGQDTAPTDTNAYGWDTHNDIFDALKVHLLPRFDASFATLLQDLDDRGLLEETLVVCMGEFGRAPRVALEPRFAGSSPGRKHWASVYSIVLAGAGVQRGGVYGASDAIGAVPARDRVTPGDVAATMFSALGIDPAGHYVDALGRPFPIATGRPMESLYG